MQYRPIEILLADDHEIFRDGFNLMVKKNPRLKLVGEAGNGRQLVEMATSLKPDIIITDIQMPVMDGLEATIEIVKKFPHIGIIALSMYGEESHILEMIHAGAKGYLLKNSHKAEIFAAIIKVSRNEYYFCSDINNNLESMVTGVKLNPFIPTGRPVFSDREIAIIRLICEEYSYKEIADRLKLSKRTIEWYCDGIVHKIKARNRNGIIVYALRHNIFRNGK